MDYTEIFPSDEISPFVKCFWEYHGGDCDIRHTIFPNGYFELFSIFEKRSLVAVLLSGLRTKPFDVDISQDITVSGVRFTLAASEYVLGKDIRTILDKTRPLELDFWDMKALEAHSLATRAAAISASIHDTLQMKETDSDKLRLLTTVYHPCRSVKDVSEEIGWDSRRINRYFNSQFGLSLKTFLNIIRLRNSFDSIKRGILYPESNYYDQSHYIKEVQKYTSLSPRELLKNRDDRFLQFSANGKS